MLYYYIKTGYVSPIMINGGEKYWMKQILHHMQCILELQRCMRQLKKIIGGMVWTKNSGFHFKMFGLWTCKGRTSSPNKLTTILVNAKISVGENNYGLGFCTSSHSEKSWCNMGDYW